MPLPHLQISAVGGNQRARTFFKQHGWSELGSDKIEQKVCFPGAGAWEKHECNGSCFPGKQRGGRSELASDKMKRSAGGSAGSAFCQQAHSCRKPQKSCFGRKDCWPRCILNR